MSDFIDRLPGEQLPIFFVHFAGGSRFDDVVSAHLTFDGAVERVNKLIYENEIATRHRWTWRREFTPPHTWLNEWRTSMGDGPTISIAPGVIEV